MVRCDWTDDQVKSLQRKLGVWPSGNLEHETWSALVKELKMGPTKPDEPKPVPPAEYYVKDHWLYQYTQKVNVKLTPNLSSGLIEPELIVIHYTGDNSLQGALSWLTTPGSQVSCHLVIAKTGQIWQLAAFNRRAWHAGQSSWNGTPDCNSYSIGIENVGIGDEWPEAQVQANIDVIKALVAAYGINEVVGHNDVAPGRKVDPGPNYPWARVLDKAGLT